MPKTQSYTAPLKATGAEVDTGTDNAKFVTPKAIADSSLGAGGGDGWTSAGETWTRTGNHTFTVSGDLTAKYGKGTKIRYKDGGAFEYGVVGSSSHAGGTTTVNLIPNADYAMADTTITEPGYSYLEKPEGFLGWFAYDPTPTNLTVGNGTLVSRWIVSKNNIMFRLRFTLGSTSSVGTIPTFTIPVEAVTTIFDATISRNIVGIGRIVDAGTASYVCSVALSTSTTMVPEAINSSSTYASANNLSSSAPMTWANNDVLFMTAEYEF